MSTLKKTRQGGLTLIEVLVALLILSTGVLALARLQILSLQENQRAYLSTQASVLAYELVDRMRANRDAAKQGAYAMDFSCSENHGVVNSRADIDRRDWVSALTTRLPNGCGKVEQRDPLVIVSIRWGADQGNTSTQVSASETLVVSTEL